MSGIIDFRKNSTTRKMADRFDLKDYRSDSKNSSIPKSWDEMGLFISTECVSKLLGVKKEVVSEWCKKGELKANKKAGKWHISKYDFMAFMEVDNTDIPTI